MFRLTSLAFLGIVLSVLLCLSPKVSAQKDTSWVDKKVMTKKAGTKIGHNVNGQNVNVATLNSMVFTVLQENGDWILVSESGMEGWFAKDDAVLLQDALSYFTRRIRTSQNDDAAYARRSWAWKERGEMENAIKDI